MKVRKCSFLDWQEKNQKKPAKGALRKGAPFGNPSRLADRCPKMSRFLNTYRSKTCRFSPGRRPKIGTFSGVGWRCGGGFLRGRLFVAPLKLTSLVTFLFSDKKVTLPHYRGLQKGILFYQLQGGTVCPSSVIPCTHDMRISIFHKKKCQIIAEKCMEKLCNYAIMITGKNPS